MIQQAREKVGITQEELAKRIGVGTQYVSNIERRLCSIPSKHFRTLSTVLKIPVKQLFHYNVERYVARMKRDMKG